MSPEHATRRIVKIDVVMAALGISRSTVYKRIRDGLMPAPVITGPRRIGFFEDEIAAHQEAMERVPYAPPDSAA